MRTRKNGSKHIEYLPFQTRFLRRRNNYESSNIRIAVEKFFVNFQDVTTENDKVTIMTTIPLTNNESWQQFAVDECLIFQDGDVVFRDTLSKKTYLTIEQGIEIARQVGASV